MLDLGVNDDGVNFYNNSVGRGYNFKNAAHDNLLVVKADGKVGIGTIDPKYPLTVSGAINAEANGDYYGAWFGGEARTSTPSINLGEWHNYRGTIFWDASDRKLVFETKTATTLHGNTMVLEDGNVGIGVPNPGNKLEVNGTIHSKKIKVEAGPWPDYVFDDSYKLLAISQLEQYIKKHKHLPEVPSAKEVEEKGLDLGEMDATLLKKVEELTLYLIDFKKENENQKLKMQN